MWDFLFRTCTAVAPLAVVLLCFQMHLLLLDLRKVRKLLEGRPPPVDTKPFE